MRTLNLRSLDSALGTLLTALMISTSVGCDNAHDDSSRESEHTAGAAGNAGQSGASGGASSRNNSVAGSPSTASSTGGSNGSGGNVNQATNSSAVSSGGFTNSATTSGSVPQIFETEGYGYVAEMSEPARVYDVTSISCINTDANPFTPNLAKLFEDREARPDGKFVVKVPEGTAPIYAVARDGLPEACKNGGTPTVGSDGYQRSPQLVFDVLWHTFNEQYAFFQTHGVDWEALREEYGAKVSNSMTDDELFEVLAAMVSELEDGHVNFGDPEAGRIVNAGAVPAAHQALYEEFKAQSDTESWGEFQLEAATNKLDIIKSKYLNNLQQSDDAKTLRWGKLNESTGYLGIDAMAGYAGDPDAGMSEDLEKLDGLLDRAFGDLKDAPNLVVDVRFNGGGYDQASLAILSRLIPAPLDVFIKQARKGSEWTEPYTAHVEPSSRVGHSDGKFILLTSALTASAAEIFTMGTLSMPGVVRIGEATEGAFSDVLIKALPNGWLFSLSNERYTDMKGTSYEGRGIPVHQEVALFSKSDREDGIDSALNAALSTLAAK